MPKVETPEIMSLNQSRKFLHLHIDTVKNLFITGQIPARQVGVREWRAYKEDLIEWVRTGNKVSKTSEV